MPKASGAPARPTRASVVGRRPKPDFTESCHPSLVHKPPAGDKWVHEIKWDSYRAHAHLDAGEVEIYTRAEAPRVGRCRRKLEGL